MIPEDLDIICEHRYTQAILAGKPPTNKSAWTSRVRRDLVDSFNEHEIERMAAGLRAAARGKKLTYCREARGSHSTMHVFDPNGTDQPPPGWSISEARRLAER